jgi:KUP system potassium uptake protein
VLGILLMIGGTFVLYMLLGQAFNFERHSHDDLSHSDSIVYSTLMETQSAPEMDTKLSYISWIGQFKAFRIGLLIRTLLGASCVIADGLLTPAVSVISAVSGDYTRLFNTDFRSRCS